MRSTRIIAPIIASAALVLLAAGPAYAAETDATITITGGALAITAPTGSVPLGSAPASPGTQDIGAPLGNVTVTDGRGGVAGWVASVISTAFTPPSGPAITASAVLYATPSATVTGTATVTAQNANGPIGVKPVQTATGVSGANTATWNPTVTVHVPAGTQPGVYTATLTHSIV
jgi:hypothetical protein